MTEPSDGGGIDPDRPMTRRERREAERAAQDGDSLRADSATPIAPDSGDLAVPDGVQAETTAQFPPVFSAPVDTSAGYEQSVDTGGPPVAPAVEPNQGRPVFDDIALGEQPAAPAGRQKNSRQSRRRRSVGSFIAMIAILLGLGALAVFVVGPILSPDSGDDLSDYPGPGSGDVSIEIPEGSSGAEIGLILKDAGVVASVDAFTQAYNANPSATSIQPGMYDLVYEMKASDAVAALLDPNRRADLRITIPEGWKAQRIYERIASIMEGVDVEEVYEAAHDYEALGLDGPPNTNPDAIDPMEGWFYPATYVVPVDATPHDVLQQMLDRTISELDSLGVEPEERLRVLTIGSIAIREVTNPAEYPQVTRVIENRLIPGNSTGSTTLGMDSTLDYAWSLRNPGETMPPNEHNTSDDPYNTRVHSGLPPSPIASIDVSAMSAALNPTEGDWTFFVSNLCTGETFFTTSLEEHNAETDRIAEWYEENGGNCITPEETSDE